MKTYSLLFWEPKNYQNTMIMVKFIRSSIVESFIHLSSIESWGHTWAHISILWRDVLIDISLECSSLVCIHLILFYSLIYMLVCDFFVKIFQLSIDLYTLVFIAQRCLFSNSDLGRFCGNYMVCVHLFSMSHDCYEFFFGDP